MLSNNCMTKSPKPVGRMGMKLLTLDLFFNALLDVLMVTSTGIDILIRAQSVSKHMQKCGFQDTLCILPLRCFSVVF